MTPWPCHRCGAQGVRNLGTQGWCADHLGALYATFDTDVFALHGVGLAADADGGAGARALVCNACAATWTGLAGEACTWCANSLARMLEHQGEMALTPPGVDPDDINYDRLLAAWGRRLWLAVLDGLVDEATAIRAWTREERRGVARTTGRQGQPVPATARRHARRLVAIR